MKRSFIASHLFSYILLGTGNSVFKGLQLVRNWRQRLSQAELKLGSLEIKDQDTPGMEAGPGALSGRKLHVPG